MPLLRLPASALQPGDVCTGSGATIVANRGTGVRTPAGKVDLIVSYSGRIGRAPRPVRWGKRTLIRVNRKPDLDGGRGRSQIENANRLTSRADSDSIPNMENPTTPKENHRA